MTIHLQKTRPPPGNFCSDASPHPPQGYHEKRARVTSNDPIKTSLHLPFPGYYLKDLIVADVELKESQSYRLESYLKVVIR